MVAQNRTILLFGSALNVRFVTRLLLRQRNMPGRLFNPAGKLDDNGVKAGIEEKQLQACFRASRLEFSPIPYVTLYVYIYIIFTRETTVSAQERHSIDIGTCTLDCSISSICQIRYGIHNDEFLGSPARSNFVDQEGLAPQ